MSVDTIGADERALQSFAGNFKSDGAQVSGRGKFLICQLVDIKGKFSSDMTVRTLIVGYTSSELMLELGKLNRSRGIDGLRMADRIANVVRQGADGEGVFVDVLSVAEQVGDEISGADVVGEVAEELFAEGVIAHVLDRRAAVGVGVRLAQLRLGGIGKAGEQQRTNAVVPCEIDQFFVGEDGIARSAEREQVRHDKNR